MSYHKTELYKDPFIWTMIGLFVVSIYGMVVTFQAIQTNVDAKELIGQIFLVRMLQVTLGMVIGSTMTFLGMVTAWFGLTDAISGEGSAKEFRLKLATASPGALLIIAGTILIFVCVTKEVSYTQEPSGTGFQELPTLPQLPGPSSNASDGEQLKNPK